MTVERSVDRLRVALDSGKGGDKVRFPDPAAAPLGSDDEAAGTPAGPDRVALAAATELSGPSHDHPRGGLGAAWVIVALVVLCVAGLGAWVLLSG